MFVDSKNIGLLNHFIFLTETMKKMIELMMTEMKGKIELMMKKKEQLGKLIIQFYLLIISQELLLTILYITVMATTKMKGKRFCN